VRPVSGAEPPGRAALALIFARIGCLSWGGGGATFAMIRDEFCVRRPLLSDEEFQLFFGLSRVVPGMNLLSLTVLIGHRFHGVPGAFLALAGLSVPSFLLIVLGCRLLRNGSPSPLLSGAIRGLGACVAALLLHATWQMLRGGSRTESPAALRAQLLLFAVTALAAAQSGVNPAWLIAGGAVVGALLFPRLEGPKA
jgi:chromate transporter